MVAPLHKHTVCEHAPYCTAHVAEEGATTEKARLTGRSCRQCACHQHGMLPSVASSGQANLITQVLVQAGRLYACVHVAGCIATRRLHAMHCSSACCPALAPQCCRNAANGKLHCKNQRTVGRACSILKNVSALLGKTDVHGAGTQAGVDGHSLGMPF